jgi:hypothetical protein
MHYNVSRPRWIFYFFKLPWYPWISIEYHEKKIKERASILKNETLVEMSIMFFEKATFCEGKFVHYKVLINQGRTPYNQTLHNSNPFSSQSVVHVIWHEWSSCQKSKCAPSLGAHRSPFELFNLVKKQIMHAHPKSQTFWLEISTSKHMDHFWANIWNPVHLTLGKIWASIKMNGWMDAKGRSLYIQNLSSCINGWNQTMQKIIVDL